MINAVTFLTFKVKVEVSECINLTINRKLKRWVGGKRVTENYWRRHDKGDFVWSKSGGLWHSRSWWSHVAKDQWGTVSLSFLWADMNDGRARARDRPFGAHYLSSVKLKWPKSAEFSYLMYFWTYYFFIPRFVVCVKSYPILYI